MASLIEFLRLYDHAFGYMSELRLVMLPMLYPNTPQPLTKEEIDHLHSEESRFLKEVHRRTKWNELRALDIKTFKSKFDVWLCSVNSDDAGVKEFTDFVINYRFVKFTQ